MINDNAVKVKHVNMLIFLRVGSLNYLLPVS